jgi:hypothetical protein
MPVSTRYDRISEHLSRSIAQEHERFEAMSSLKPANVREEVFKATMRQLDDFYDPIQKQSIKRQVLQCKFHAEMLKACIPTIFREEYERNRQSILRRWKFDDINTKVQVFAARRMGKTFSVCMLIASLLLQVPGIRIAVFGVALRTAIAIVKQVTRFLKSTPAFANFKAQVSAQEITLEMGADIRVLTAFPASTDVSIFQKMARGIVYYVLYIFCVCTFFLSLSQKKTTKKSLDGEFVS